MRTYPCRSRWSPMIWTTILLGVFAISPALGQTSGASTDWGGWGLRFGFAADPDQGVIGGLYDFGTFGGGFHIELDVDLGVGDNSTTLVTTGAFHYRFGRPGEFRPYLGAGPAFGFINRDHPRGKGDDTDFEVGLKVLGGLRWPLSSGNEFFVEMGLGIGDLHDGTFVAGWRF